MSRTCLAEAALLALTLAVATSAHAKDEEPTPAESAADEAARDIVGENFDDWDPRSVKSFATQNLRLQGGAGWVTLRNPTDDILVEGIGVNGHLHLGDTFFEFLSYYVPVRATLLSFEQTTVGGTTVTSFNDRQALLVESGLGLELWLWPKLIVLSGEGVLNFLSLTTEPVRRAEPALAREAIGGAVRGRATVQFNSIGVYGEYTQQLMMQDLTNGSNWESSQIFVGLTYHLGDKFDF
jgi:hypothetical protein